MKNKSILLFPIFFIAVFLLENPVYADSIPVDEVEVITPVYSPEPGTFEPKFGKYTYSVAWQGIPAGTLEIHVEKNESDYHIRASARTNKFINIFYKLRFKTEAAVCSVNLYPKTSVYNNRQNNRREITEIEFLPGGEIKSKHIDRRGDIEKLQFAPNNFTLDPFSAVFLAMSLNWEVGDTRQFDIFTGKSRYLVELSAVDKTDLRVKGKTREAIVISPKVTKLTEGGDSESDDKLREARIYVSTDTSREILRISSDVFVGTITTTMTSFFPSSGNKDQSSPAEDAPAPDIQPDFQRPPG